MNDELPEKCPLCGDDIDIEDFEFGWCPECGSFTDEELPDWEDAYAIRHPQVKPR